MIPMGQAHDKTHERNMRDFDRLFEINPLDTILTDNQYAVCWDRMRRAYFEIGTDEEYQHKDAESARRRAITACDEYLSAIGKKTRVYASKAARDRDRETLGLNV